MQRTIRWLMAAMMAMLLSPAAACPVAAEAGLADFAATPVLPSNQKSSKGVFDLVMQPGQRQEIKVKLKNSAPDERVYAVEVFTATTSRQGQVEYGAPGTSDITLPHPMEDILRPELAEVTLQGGEEQELAFAVTMPQQAFEGYLLGAIHITPQAASAEDAEQAEDTALRRERGQSIAVRLTVRDNLVSPDFALGEVRVEAEDGKGLFLTELRNPAPRLVSGVGVDNRIYAAGASEPLFAMTGSDVEMAPNSVYQIPLADETGEGVPPGEYRSVLKVTWNGTLWEFEKQITVTPDMAVQSGRAAEPVLKRAESPWSLPLGAVIAVGAGVVLAAAALIIALKLRSEKKDYERFMQMLEQKQRDM